jgi:multidrug efflux pump subunit AcrB
MLHSLISFFLKNEKFNYSLFVFIVVLGVLTYQALPKEKFPIMDLDRILITGSYTKISNDLLDKIAVSEIEKEIKSIEGIDKVITTISNGAFSIFLELKDNQDKSSISDKLRDAVTKASQNLPSDMNLPTVAVVERVSEVIKVGLTSSSKNQNNILNNVDLIKDKLLNINGIANVEINGELDKIINIAINPQKAEVYELSIEQIANAIQNLSYIYPLGKIEQQDSHLFLLSESGKDNPIDLQNTLLKFGEKIIYLKDVATVTKQFEDNTRISSVNLNSSITFEVYKFENANSIKVAKNVKDFVNNWQDSDLKLFYFLDDSVSIRDRLNNVVSNIILGIILVFFSIYFFVSRKMAFVVTIGVPTSFFIAFVFLYISGYSLNLISLLGLLIALGVLVDDAIIVSENIQRHVENGEDIHTASYNGTREVIAPVTMASLTTIFTFMPLLFLSGITGNFIIMIPIVVTVLVVASYFESFFFLPLHAKHLIKKGDSVRSWEKAKNIYKKILKFHIKYKKSFLITFIVLIPILTFFAMKNTKFQFFPRIDAPILYVSGKIDKSNTLEETEQIANKISSEIWQQKEKLGIANISTITGFRRTPVGERENGENLFYIYIELYEQVPQNFVEKYITPYFSFDYDESNKIRKVSNSEILKTLNQNLLPLKKELKIEDLSVFKKRIGVKVDVEIGILAHKTEDIFKAINTLESQINNINGISSVSNNALRGIDEMILKINKYGESLGINERNLANIISNLYLSNKKSMAIDENELLEIIIERTDKNSLNALKSMRITLDTGEVVRLVDIVDFEFKETLETVNKYDFLKMKSIFINVDTRIITADEVLKKLKPTFVELKKQNIEFDFLGEKERKDTMKKDLQKASLVALALIFFTLLYAFRSFLLTFVVLSVIPFSLLGVLVGHFIMDLNLTMPGIIGAFGLAGVVINDSIVMISFLKQSDLSNSDILEKASQRFRPIILTSITTLLGLSTLIFFVSGQGLILQPIAVSLGYGLAWGTVLNLIYLPVLFAIINQKKSQN